MAKRLIDTGFWTDDEVIERFTVDDKYFWLYLMTNQHVNITGVMPLCRAAMARDLGYDIKTLDNLLYRFATIHTRIEIDDTSKELLILDWPKYNWTNSPKLHSAVGIQAKKIKSAKFRAYVLGALEKQPSDTVSIPYGYRIISSIDIKDNIEDDDTIVEDDTYITKEEKNIPTPSYSVKHTTHHTLSCAHDNNITNDNNNIIESQADTPKLSPQAQEIYDLWKEIGPIKPRVPSEAIVKAIKAALGKFSIKDITEAITHYVDAYNDPKYFFKYKWDLATFLKQRNCIPNFMEGGVAWENYKAHKGKETPQRVFVEIEPQDKKEKEYE